MLLFWLVVLSASVSANINPYPKTYKQNVDGDPGPTLFLTPYIKKNQFEEAKNLSRVPPLKGNITSYSGFITVDEECDSNMFFWFFPAVLNPESAPVVLWLNGGPGSSSLFGLFTENGPYELTPSGYLKLRKYSWGTTNSMLYIDNPVGTGYSFAKSMDCFSKTEVEVGKNLHNALVQFFKLFSELQVNPFYITGESYAGKYVPAVAYTIHNENPNAEVKINLKGIAIGNGLIDPENQFRYGDYLYQLGLIDLNTLNVFHTEENLTREHIAKKEWYQAFQCFDRLLNGDKLGGPTIFTNATGYTYYFNYLYSNPAPEGDFSGYVQRTEIRSALHVGNSTWGNGGDVEQQLLEDMMQSVRPWVQELLEHYRVLIYNGQLDIIVAYPLTLGFLQKLEWSGTEQYKTAPRYHWYVDNELAGYVKHAGKLTEVLVRNAGHMVPHDQPKWAWDLLSRFINQKSFNDLENML